MVSENDKRFFIRRLWGEISVLGNASLAAFAALGRPNPGRMAQQRDCAERALRQAADLPDGGAAANRSVLESLLVANSGPGGEDCRAKSPETCRCKGAKPQRKPALTPSKRAQVSAEMAAAGKSDAEIYAEQRQHMLDDATMKDVVEYKKKRKDMTRRLRDKFQNKTVQCEDENLPLLTINKKGIKEMADDKALDKSVRLGCSVGEHVEALHRLDELLRDGVVAGTRAGNQGRHAGNAPVSKVSELRSGFLSQVSGERCEAVFSVHEEKGTLPYAYFMYTKRERPKQ